ncbi:hypothetical protein [Parasediminibacterium sp. JCM 36343]|uniref:hypothetical protein n=1 Tax=Parasediminibacterium sp. JCM 36343 TaxID=3374279 RepID=UPI00397C85F0
MPTKQQKEVVATTASVKKKTTSKKPRPEPGTIEAVQRSEAIAKRHNYRWG